MSEFAWRRLRGVRRRTQYVKVVPAITLASLIVCAPATAKPGISIRASDTTPTAGQRVTFDVGSERPLDYDLRLIAVSPGQSVFRVVATITGDTSHPDPDVARHGLRSTFAAPGRAVGAAWHASGDRVAGVSSSRTELQSA
jgi:hypothetical protein